MTTQNTVAPGRGILWRPLTKRERTLVCSCEGLLLGDCTEQVIEGSAYCYYHNKVLRGDITYFEANMAKGIAEVSPTHYYPVWPLPVTGYVLLYPKEEMNA